MFKQITKQIVNTVNFLLALKHLAISQWDVEQSE